MSKRLSHQRANRTILRDEKISIRERPRQRVATRKVMVHAFNAILLISLWSAYVLSRRIEANPSNKDGGQLSVIEKIQCSEDSTSGVKCASAVASDRNSDISTSSTTTATQTQVVQAEAKKNPVIPKKIKPLKCTRAQHEKIRTQLQPFECRITKDRPFLHMCSYTRATKCPEQTWLDDFFKNLAMTQSRTSSSFLGLSVGCNKGFDALDTMRMGTANTAFDKERWRKAMNNGGAVNIDRGNCRQDKSKQMDVSSWKQQKGEMHCIEPLTKTYERLEEATKSLKLNSLGFTASHYAIAKESGKALFPRTHIGASDTDYKRVNVGTENKGLSNCGNIVDKEKRADLCEEINVLSLDDYVRSHVQSKGPIHTLNIDVEGYDFDVLLGANEALKRTQYLEFEYNWKGSWAKQHLKDAIEMLDDLDFTCYWAGKNMLWRITGCWWDYYDYHHWSNVACVNRSQAKLAVAMEGLFLKTLQDDTIIFK